MEVALSDTNEAFAGIQSEGEELQKAFELSQAKWAANEPDESEPETEVESEQAEEVRQSDDSDTQANSEGKESQGFELDSDVESAPTEIKTRLKALAESGDKETYQAVREAYKSMQADYTRKRQADSEDRKAWEEQRRELENYAEVAKAMFGDERGKQYIQDWLNSQDADHGAVPEDFDMSLASPEEQQKYLDRMVEKRVQEKIQEAQRPQVYLENMKSAVISYYQEKASDLSEDQFRGALDSLSEQLYGMGYTKETIDSIVTPDTWSGWIEPHVSAIRASIKADAATKAAEESKADDLRAAKASSPQGRATVPPAKKKPWEEEGREPTPTDFAKETIAQIIERYGQLPS